MHRANTPPPSPLHELLQRNRRWASEKTRQDPEFFQRLSRQQAPRFLWIGCSDSRVPASEITGVDPGTIFVHRNVANLVISTDMNLLAVLQFAVEVLQVEEIVVVGHYGCGGVTAAAEPVQHGLIDNWLRPIKDIWRLHEAELLALRDDDARMARLCELNVMEQAHNVAKTTIVQNAWAKGRAISVNGWIYGLRDGVIRDLEVPVHGPGDLEPVFRMQPPR